LIRPGFPAGKTLFPDILTVYQWWTSLGEIYQPDFSIQCRKFSVVDLSGPEERQKPQGSGAF
jgi:hypothetical protein